MPLCPTSRQRDAAALRAATKRSQSILAEGFRALGFLVQEKKEPCVLVKIGSGLAHSIQTLETDDAAAVYILYEPPYFGEWLLVFAWEPQTARRVLHALLETIVNDRTVSSLH